MQPTIVKSRRVPKTEDLMFFMVLCEVMEFHRTTFQADLTGQPKMDFNILNGHLQKWRLNMQTRISPESREQIDNLGAVGWEVLNELMQAKDKRQFLAVVKSFNEGLIRMEGFDVPANEVPFGDVIAQGKTERAEPVQPPQSAAA